MLLSLENIGKIDQAQVELNGITVIAGKNNTGKSTVGKVLFCIFNSFYRIKEKIFYERQNSVLEIFSNIKNVMPFFDLTLDDIPFAEMLIRNKQKFCQENTLLANELEVFFRDHSIDMDLYEIETIAKRIATILAISDNEILKKVLEKKLSVEFNSQINNLYAKDLGKINLTIRDVRVDVLIENNKIEDIKNNLDLSTEVIYIDDPFVLDDLNARAINPYVGYANHQGHLKQVLCRADERNEIKSALDEIIITGKIKGILEKINVICSGNMIKNRMSFGYQKQDSEVVLDVKNISTGLKTFVILKTLLLNNSLEENGTIVLDEPEIHLHPEWQVLFAELIVLLQKEFNMHILLNTHSPYFLRAIQVYSAKHEIADKCKYYLAENFGEKARLEDVTTDIDKIYSRLAKPFEALERELFDYECAAE